jgi:exodeoxyribonuclease VII small subunit
LKLFEEGMKLTKECNQRLTEIEKKVKQLLKTAKNADETESSKSK